MRKLITSALLGLAACGPAMDPADPSAMVPPLALEPPPIYSLLGYRTELKLTSAQVSALDSIASVVEDSTREPVALLRRRASENSRTRGMILLTDDVRPVLEQVRERHRLASLAVQEVLDETQEAAVCGLYEPSRGDAARLRARREGRGRTREQDRDRRMMGGFGADSVNYLPRSAWVWCGRRTPSAGASADTARRRSRRRVV